MSVSAPLIDSFVRFCESPLRGKEEIEQDYERLVTQRMVVSIGFHKPHILMVGTKPIIISSEGTEYNIGEFIIFLIRKREGRVWETGVRFANTTHPIWEKNGDGSLSGVMHPHIAYYEYEDIEMPTGDLCIAQGGFALYQAIRKGQMDKAVAMLVTILHSYGTGQPFRHIEAWKTKGKSDD